ncbi:MAG: hypothetical protein MUO53_05905 [Maribacter sp.]|nr:hypothetical protein [Maribacter sp.]
MIANEDLESIFFSNFAAHLKKRFFSRVAYPPEANTDLPTVGRAHSEVISEQGLDGHRFGIENEERVL